MKTRKIHTPCTAIIPPLGQLTLGPREIFVGFRKIVTRRLAHSAALYHSGGLAASTLSATPRSAATSRGTEKSRLKILSPPLFLYRSGSPATDEKILRQDEKRQG